MYYGNRIICPACGMVSADEDYCTECGEVLLIEVAKADRLKDFDITECSRLVCKYWMEVSNTKKQKQNGI